MTGILKEIKHQKIRLWRTDLALLGALFHTIACTLLWYVGVFRMSFNIFILVFTIIWLVNLSFPLLILTGMNKRFKDPSMTLYMVLWSQIVVMFSLYFMNDYRPLMLLFGVLGIAFCAYRLETKQSIFVALFSLLLYLVVIFLLNENHPNLLQAIPEWTVGLSYACIAFSTAIITAELSATRRYLSNKTLELESSMYTIQSDTKIQSDMKTGVTTGIRSRRNILEVIEEQRNITDREPNYDFSVALFSLDHYKTILESEGRLVGDRLLKFFTMQVELQLRKTDYFARMGGEEFLLVCPFTNRDKCHVLVKRIAEGLANANLNDIIPKLTFVVSIGITEYRPPEKLESMLNRLDKALDKAKKQGGNQIYLD